MKRRRKMIAVLEHPPSGMFHPGGRTGAKRSGEFVTGALTKG